MKIIELLQRPSVPVTNEELELLDKLRASQTLTKKDLDQRELYLMDQLIHKDLAVRKIKNESIEYTISARVR